MSSTRDRIGVLSVGLGLGVLLLCGHLWLLMVQQQPVWSARSHENRWAFRAVPSQRGSLLDRHGRPLAVDEPTTELAVHYVVFRRRHPIGAAVHGATLLARLRAGDQAAEYRYVDGPRGPEMALQDLYALPLRFLARGALPKQVASELASAITTVLASCSGRSRSRVFAAIRQAALARDERTIADLAEPTVAEVFPKFRERWAALRQLDAQLTVLPSAGARGGEEADARGLFATLEFLRRASLDETRVTWQQDGEEKVGNKLEEIARTFAEDVPFDLAAELRVAADHFQGIRVAPAVRRVRSVAVSPLRVLLGDVVALDRAMPSAEWLAQQLERELPPDWLTDLADTDEAGMAIDRDQVAAEARQTYARQLLQHERRGTTGLEAAFDDELTGRLGLRLVEQDSRRREQRQWNHLRVQAGADVRITLDLDLQLAAERATATAHERQRDAHTANRDADKVEAALAVIDAQSGDVLAYAGSPVVSGGARDLPGVVWVLNGALGSVVKPFVLVEQLQCENTGRPHRSISTFEPCNDAFRYAGRVLRCSHAHWNDGIDPVTALAESCNLFYYQCASGLLDDGLARALRRFGLAPPAGSGDPFAACWQPTVRGLPVAAPRRDTKFTDLPQRAVGYGVEASPLHVARAYAVFATGWLPTLGFRPEARPRVLFDDVVSETAVVQQGLRACVQQGTARRLPLLAELGVAGKTGTAEVGADDQNNAWFAGYLPHAAQGGVQLCFCAVVYWVKDRVHGGEAAGQLVVDFLSALKADPQLHRRYLVPEGGR